MNRGALFVLIAATLWGTTGTAQSLAPDAAQPLIIGTLRMMTGGFALVIIAYFRGQLRSPLMWPRLPTLFAVLGIALYQLTFFAGVSRTGVAVGTIVGIGSAPIMAGILGYMTRDERLSWQWALATALAITGSVILVASGAEIGVDVLGIVLSLGAGLSYSVYAIATKGLLDEYPPESVVAGVFGLAGVLLLPLLFTADIGWLAEPGGILVVLHLGLITKAVGYTLFSRGLMQVQAATAVTLTLAEPLTAGLLGVIVVGEALTPFAFVGVALLFAGLAILSLQRRPKPEMVEQTMT